MPDLGYIRLDIEGNGYQSNYNLMEEGDKSYISENDEEEKNYKS